MMVLSFSEYKHMFLHIEKIILIFFVSKQMYLFVVEFY